MFGYCWQPFEDYTVHELITSYVQSYSILTKNPLELEKQEELIISMLDIVKIDESILHITAGTSLHSKLIQYFKLS